MHPRTRISNNKKGETPTDRIHRPRNHGNRPLSSISVHDIRAHVSEISKMVVARIGQRFSIVRPDGAGTLR